MTWNFKASNLGAWRAGQSEEWAEVQKFADESWTPQDFFSSGRLSCPSKEKRQEAIREIAPAVQEYRADFWQWWRENKASKPNRSDYISDGEWARAMRIKSNHDGNGKWYWSSALSQEFRVNRQQFLID